MSHLAPGPDRSGGRAADIAFVLGRLGLPPARVSFQPLGTSNQVWSLQEPPLVLNVAARRWGRRQLADRLAVASVLADHGVFVSPEPGVAQPVETPNHALVTVWQRVDVLPRPLDWELVGRALRTMHDLPRSAFGPAVDRLPDLHDLTDIERALGELEAARRISAADAAMLSRVRARLGDELAAGLAHPGGDERVVVHGDLHPPNLLRTESGYVLCDIDELGVAHRYWDLALMVDPGRVGTRAAEVRSALSRGYGGPLPDLALTRAMVRASHLRLTVRKLARSERSLTGAYYDRLRLASWRDVERDWSLDLHPVVCQPRPQQLVRVLRHLGPVRRASASARGRGR